jgi:hypothetical protein
VSGVHRSISLRPPISIFDALGSRAVLLLVEEPAVHGPEAENGELGGGGLGGPDADRLRDARQVVAEVRARRAR